MFFNQLLFNSIFDKIIIVKYFDNENFVNIFDHKIIVMKNVIGTPARGDSFFPREREVRKIISRLKNGNNLNLAAPRRVGKTSILYYLLDNKEADYVYVYVDTEAVNNEQDFFKKIFRQNGVCIQEQQ